MLRETWPLRSARHRRIFSAEQIAASHPRPMDTVAMQEPTWIRSLQLLGCEPGAGFTLNRRAFLHNRPVAASYPQHFRSPWVTTRVDELAFGTEVIEHVIARFTSWCFVSTACC